MPILKNPDRIFSGELLRLMPLTDNVAIQACDVPINFIGESKTAAVHHHRLEPARSNYLNRYRTQIPTQRDEEDAFWMLAWLEQNYGILSTSAAGGFNTMGGLVSRNTNAFVAEVKLLYQQYQQGLITKGQYAYRRQKALAAYAQKLGPFEKILFKGQTVQEAIRITRSKALPATAQVDAHLGRLNSLSRMTKYGGIALSVAGMGVGCYQIANSQSRQEKNEIFVETVISTAAGVISSAGLALIMFSNPVGWGVALVLGVGAAVGSYQSGKLASKIYDTHFNEYDLTSATGVDRLCR